MHYSKPARTAARRTRSIVLAPLVVVGATLTGVLIGQSLASPSSSAAPPTDIPPGDLEAALGEADGALPDGATVFDDQYPGVANLDPELLKALREAATDAANDGVTFYVNSGWRTPAYQNQLLREAVSKYSSPDEAARWVATADTSPHVSGDAIDIGGSDARAWLSEHGATYGLCQIYRNEPWHYELRPDAVDHGCPAMYADPTHDPRMHGDRRHPPIPS